MFRTLVEQQEMVTITLDGTSVEMPKDVLLAAALLNHGDYPSRTVPVHECDGQKTRAPYCMMGVCFECLVEIDGVPNQQSCLVFVRKGMAVRRQKGSPDTEQKSPLEKPENRND